MTEFPFSPCEKKVVAQAEVEKKAGKEVADL
jgi:hypothetical protein